VAPGDFQGRLEHEGIDSRRKTETPNATNGRFGRDRFAVDLEGDRTTRPAGVTVSIGRHSNGGEIAKFGEACTSCAMHAGQGGRSIAVGPNEAVLARRAPARSTPTGSLITGPPDRRSSARSRISCDASTAVAESGSPPTSSSSPPLLIRQALGRSAHAPPAAGGTSLGREKTRIAAGSGCPTPPGATRAAK